MIDLTPYSKQPFVTLRFAFNSDPYNSFDGWYIDDIHIIAFDEKLLDAPTGETPSGFALGQNAPNPFTTETAIGFSLAEKSCVTINVYNALGICIATLADGLQSPGSHIIRWATGRNPGLYLYQMRAVPVAHPERVFMQTRRMAVVR